MGATWQSFIGPRGALIFAQLDATCHNITRPQSTNHNSPRQQVPNQLQRHRTSCHVTATCESYGLYGQVQSASFFFCLFGSTNRSRYLLHTDSVCKSKYTTGIKKMRQTQWHYFCLIPSTLKIEQNLIPWSKNKKRILRKNWLVPQEI